jgi:hypothetical protein
MTSISDLGKPTPPWELLEYATRSAAEAAMLRMESERLAQISSVLSQDFSTKLGSPRAPVYEVIVEPSPIVEIMQADARRKAEAVKRPFWKRWGFWYSVAGSVGVLITFVLGVLTYVKTFGW